MTNEMILRKAIEKAVKDGYKMGKELLELQEKQPLAYDVNAKYFYYSFIFSHDFAKHFWGRDWVCDCCGEKSCWEGNIMCGRSRNASVLELWEFHLQQMVRKIEPLHYLEQFLERGEK